MNEFKDIRDDQIRIIGDDDRRGGLPRWAWLVITSILIIIIAGVVALVVYNNADESANMSVASEPTLFEPESIDEPAHIEWLGSEVDSLQEGFTEIKEMLINDIPIRIFIPHNGEMSLHIGLVDKSDKSIIYVAQAADVRADNGGIVGAFVLEGEPRAWGLSKRGYCASINGRVTVGVADSSPLFEQATEEEGYFFRQYPLVSNGELIENAPKGKSIRRAICDRQGEIFMVETASRESFHDFAQALVDLGVDQAIYLVGSTAYGWAVDESGVVHEFGEDNYYSGRYTVPKNINYLVWRKKN